MSNIISASIPDFGEFSELISDVRNTFCEYHASQAEKVGQDYQSIHNQSQKIFDHNIKVLWRAIDKHFGNKSTTRESDALKRNRLNQMRDDLAVGQDIEFCFNSEDAKIVNLADLRIHGVSARAVPECETSPHGTIFDDLAMAEQHCKDVLLAFRFAQQVFIKDYFNNYTGPSLDNESSTAMFFKAKNEFADRLLQHREEELTINGGYIGDESLWEFYANDPACRIVYGIIGQGEDFFNNVEFLDEIARPISFGYQSNFMLDLLREIAKGKVKLFDVSEQPDMSKVVLLQPQSPIMR